MLLLSETSFKNTGFYSFVAFKPADLHNHEPIERDTCPLSLSLSGSLSLLSLTSLRLAPSSADEEEEEAEEKRRRSGVYLTPTAARRSSLLPQNQPGLPPPSPPLCPSARQLTRLSVRFERAPLLLPLTD